PRSNLVSLAPRAKTCPRDRHSCAEKLPGSALGAEHVEGHMPSVLRQDFEFAFALSAPDSPDAPDQPPFVAQPSPGGIVATVGQFEANRRLANAAQERTPCADPPRCVEEHDGVCAREPKVERGVVVAVDDPLVAREQDALLLAPLVLGRRHPTRVPEMEVEMD